MYYTPGKGVRNTRNSCLLPFLRALALYLSLRANFICNRPMAPLLCSSGAIYLAITNKKVSVSLISYY